MALRFRRLLHFGGAVLAAVALSLGLLCGQPSVSTAVVPSAVLAHAPGNPKAFTFEAKVHGKPVHWDKCKVIHYRVNLKLAPHGAISQVKEAVHRLHAASGLRLRYDGKTTARPGDVAQYPKRTRLVVGWLPHGVFSRVAGYGGISYNMDTGEVVRGFVQMNAGYNKKLANGFGAGPINGAAQGTEGQLLMHELGHAVGLNHVRDARQIMYASMTHKKAVWGAGDRNGLLRVGSMRACF